MAFRLAQTVLVAAVALLLMLLALNNVTDYGSNFSYVEHVLSMDSVLPVRLLDILMSAPSFTTTGVFCYKRDGLIV